MGEYQLTNLEGPEEPERDAIEVLSALKNRWCMKSRGLYNTAILAVFVSSIVVGFFVYHIFLLDKPQPQERNPVNLFILYISP
jgi:hypothetical protein